MIYASQFIGAVIIFLGVTTHAFEQVPDRKNNSEIPLEGLQKLLEKTESFRVESASETDRSLKEVGQIIAVKSRVPFEESVKFDWSELDPALTRKLGINLNTVGKTINSVALGVSYMPRVYGSVVRVGETVKLGRYGLEKAHLPGRIVAVVEPPDQDTMAVVFEMTNSENWEPGISCDLEIASVRMNSVKVPAHAIVHIGTEEYVLKKMADRLLIRHIALLDENKKTVTVAGDLAPNDEVVARGAILFKPIMQRQLKNPERK